jgi:uncharacterized RmlC-like cupin family protein
LFRLWESVAEQLTNAGIAWSVSVIMAENSASLRAQRRSGAHVVAAGIRLRLGSRFCTHVDVAPRTFWVPAGLPRSPMHIAADLDRTAFYRRFRSTG